MTTVRAGSQVRPGQARPQLLHDGKWHHPSAQLSREARPHDRSRWIYAVLYRQNQQMVCPGRERSSSRQQQVASERPQILRSPHAPSLCGVVALPSGAIGPHPPEQVWARLSHTGWDLLRSPGCMSSPPALDCFGLDLHLPNAIVGKVGFDDVRSISQRRNAYCM